MIINIYKNKNGKEPFYGWLSKIKDKQTKMRILHRIERLQQGNFGDCKSLGGNLYELRFFFGSGYRVYFGKEGTTILILLCGGDKSSQQKDINLAKVYLKDHYEK